MDINDFDRLSSKYLGPKGWSVNNRNNRLHVKDNNNIMRLRVIHLISIHLIIIYIYMIRMVNH